MKYYPKNNQTLIVLEKGEELISSLNKFAIEQNLKGGWINVIGGAAKVELGFYDIDSKEYQWKELSEPLEITGLQGNLTFVDGEPFWHIHGTFSRSDFSTIAGHVKSCIIGLTGEVFLAKHDYDLTRTFDEETGLKLITE